jgi:hypothetical protein
MHRDVVTQQAPSLSALHRCGLICGEWIAFDGLKLRVVASVDSTPSDSLCSAISKASRKLTENNRHVDRVDCKTSFPWMFGLVLGRRMPFISYISHRNLTQEERNLFPSKQPILPVKGFALGSGQQSSPREQPESTGMRTTF